MGENDTEIIFCAAHHFGCLHTGGKVEEVWNFQIPRTVSSLQNLLFRRECDGSQWFSFHTASYATDLFYMPGSSQVLFSSPKRWIYDFKKSSDGFMANLLYITLPFYFASCISVSISVSLLGEKEQKILYFLQHGCDQLFILLLSIKDLRKAIPT